MSKKKGSRQSRVSGPFTFIRNLVAGDFGPVERARRVAGNLTRRGTRGSGCCGQYGEPGC